MAEQEPEIAEETWRAQLSPERYTILRQAATEPAFSGDLLHEEGEGKFTCAGCQTPLFASQAKYDSGSGWPSFDAAISDGIVVERQDRSHGMLRIEILCAACHGHLGHLFDDGPTSTGLRYCVNSLSLEFSPES
ncbi:MAG: peptide-methionine (R)-S-oxide reductase MsrB [Actinobacteria bacterium]|nr:peptide-methionine (R)-S-oxide reductase MsrB [Actinomycetota bacterium]